MNMISPLLKSLNKTAIKIKIDKDFSWRLEKTGFENSSINLISTSRYFTLSIPNLF